MQIPKVNNSIGHILTLGFLVIGFSLGGCDSTPKYPENLPSLKKTDLSTNLLDDQGVAMQNVTKGVDFAAQGKFNEAKVEFEKALKVDPYNDLAKTSIIVIEDLNDKTIESKTAILWFKGSANHIEGLWDNAIAEYSKVIEMNPKLAGAYNSRGFVYDEKGQHDDAIADFTKAIELSRDNAEPYYNRGTAYYEKDQHDDAIADFTKAIELNPKLTDAYNNRGLAYDKKGQHDKAIADYSMAIETNPMDVKAYFNRGN
ncbi:MAG: tetratricopeptide repeat protein, partial [Desulfobacteraceae bacterium]|nr:tetratricopeptide repeat protein [Desulfobacteraceae bacterium]